MFNSRAKGLMGTGRELTKDPNSTDSVRVLHKAADYEITNFKTFWIRNLVTDRKEITWT